MPGEWQGWAVGAAVLVALIYLLRKWLKKGGGKGPGCGKCGS